MKQPSVIQNARKLLRFLARRKETLSPVLILTHNYPDPDALACAVALQYLMEAKYGITSKVAYGGVIGRTENRAMVSVLKLPVHHMSPRYFQHYRNVALVDTQPEFGNNAFPAKRRAAMVIDQHPSVKKCEAELNIVDTECGATSVILAQALLHAKVKIPDKIATALVYGILSDTQNLYRARQPYVLSTYMAILPHCDLKALVRIQNPPRPRRFFSTLGKAIEYATSRRGLMIAHLGWVENPDLVSQIADFLLTYKGIHKVMCTGRYRRKLRVSLRLVKPGSIGAGEILRDVLEDRDMAGGHDVIAGGTLEIAGAAGETEWQEAEHNVTVRMMKRLRIPIEKEPYYPFRRQA